MTYWWVNQGDNFKTESSAGYLWAPKGYTSKRSRKLQTRPDWENVANLKEGDIAFSYSDRKLRSYCEIETGSIDYESPYPKDYAIENIGRLVLAKYTPVVAPLAYREIVDGPNAISLAGASPKLQLVSKPALGYLFRLPDDTGEQLWARVVNSQKVNASTQPLISQPGETTKLRLKLARIGQGSYGKEVRAAFGFTCGITKIALPGLILQAAHIKPWSLSNDSERLDPENGLLLHASLHHAFDQGLIGFSQNGEIIFKTEIKPYLHLLGVSDFARLPAAVLTKRRLAYLLDHQLRFKLS